MKNETIFFQNCKNEGKKNWKNQEKFEKKEFLFFESKKMVKFKEYEFLNWKKKYLIFLLNIFPKKFRKILFHQIFPKKNFGF